MKKLILGLSLFAFSVSTKAQNGLENIIVEKYYVSDANDTTQNGTGGILPVGSVTYRIYLDMLPGYKFQAVFGVPGHELRLQTTTLFFNNEDRGATSPTYNVNQAADNTVMLDSWLSSGAACNGFVGVLKADDDGLGTVANNDAVLMNADTAAGIPLTQQDGMISGSPEPVTAVGISTEMAMFDNQNDGSNGPLFSTSNGSWASLNGSTGADSTTNKVLIAQMTTDGTFSFELNIQIGTPTGGVEQYVAQNAIAPEILFAPCIYTSVPTAISNPDKSSETFFTLYPNPAYNNISLEIMTDKMSSGNYYRIYDAQGRLIKSKMIGNVSEYYSENIDISTFAIGKYILELYLDGKTSSQQIIKD